MQHTQEMVDSQLQPLNIQRVGPYTYWSKPSTFLCGTCNHVWSTTPRRILHDGTRCPKCAANYKSTTADFIKKAVDLHGTKYTYNNVVYVKASQPVLITCSIHGDFNQTPNSHLTGYGCTICAGNTRTSNEEFDSKLELAKRGVKRVGQYQGSHVPLTVKCETCDHEWSAKPTKLIGARATGCPKCRTKHGVFGTFTEAHGRTFRSILESECYGVVQNYCADKQFTFECQKRYPQSTTNHSCDFYIVELKLWIEVLCINTDTYVTRLDRKAKWIQELGENFIFAKTTKSLKDILYGQI